ncbi:hypothetical protein, partial [Nigerium massiliense]|uniref:hypothetical protein n=1 Tax=Nigerium massiliense TaxID=1522317 RepID=UPI001C455DDD
PAFVLSQDQTLHRKNKEQDHDKKPEKLASITNQSLKETCNPTTKARHEATHKLTNSLCKKWH